MNSQQQEWLLHVLAEFASHGRSEITDAAMQQIGEHTDQLQFAWAGGTNLGDPHYFRVVMPNAFMVEYANTQNGANHAHAVWRMFNGDFGRDLLKEHLSSGH